MTTQSSPKKPNARRTPAGKTPDGTPVNQVILGDCVEVMNALPAKCADLVFAAPPQVPSEWRYWLVARSWTSTKTFRTPVPAGVVAWPWIVNGSSEPSTRPAIGEVIVVSTPLEGVVLSKSKKA